MSFSREIRNLADVHEAKTGSNAQNLIRSLLNSFPDDFELSTGENVLAESLNHMNLDDQHSGMLTPINYDRSAASTPSLSLPDSFDVDCFNVVKDMRAAKEVTYITSCDFKCRLTIHKVPTSCQFFLQAKYSARFPMTHPTNGERCSRYHCPSLTVLSACTTLFAILIRLKKIPQMC